MSRVSLKGSEKNAIPHAEALTGKGDAPNPDKYIEVTLSIRRKKELPDSATPNSAMSHEQLEQDHGIADADLAAVEAFAGEYHLKVTEHRSLVHTIKLAGRLEDMEKAFGTKLQNVRLENNVFRQREGSLTIPSQLEGIVEGVFGLDDRPAARPRFRPSAHTAAAFTPLQVAALYNFPPGDGTGQVIAIIELDGGFNNADLTQYFSSIGVSRPTVVAVPVSGGTNHPTGDTQGPDGEVMLDIEVAGAIAPKAKIKVYFAPNTDKGFLDAINEAISDPETPAVISISWGGPEDKWTSQSRNAFEKAFQNAAALSIPVAVASGDNGSTDGSGHLDVDFPSSAPHALACGGTHLEGSTSITKEVVWNSQGGATGGGVSRFFPKPAWQHNINVIPPPTHAGGRQSPDVCGCAAPETGYKVRVDGTDTVIGGTSAVAPLWAGLIARMAQHLGRRVPFLHPILYTHPTAFHDITVGNNDTGGAAGKYPALTGWDACTGLGSPKGLSILGLLGQAAPPAGNGGTIGGATANQ
ncbi:S53 family peptidase [Puia dinghuensis]|uniref:Kumamolisin n=1 Tax=Puia dinghuensis TaxID=1792502 RepID=A0A8J2XW40_9BACT|nr:S53 family peptidase [Puia dinghuensis]GGB23372.1 kumamolisin [Puia dinghuensis]